MLRHLFVLLMCLLPLQATLAAVEKHSHSQGLHEVEGHLGLMETGFVEPTELDQHPHSGTEHCQDQSSCDGQHHCHGHGSPALFINVTLKLPPLSSEPAEGPLAVFKAAQLDRIERPNWR